MYMRPIERNFLSVACGKVCVSNGISFRKRWLTAAYIALLSFNMLPFWFGRPEF